MTETMLHRVWFRRDVGRIPALSHLAANAPYVVTDGVLWRNGVNSLQYLEQEAGRRFIERTEPITADAKLWNGVDDLNGRYVAYYDYGGLGDTLIATAMVHELRHRYPSMQLVVFTSVSAASLWNNHPDLYEAGARLVWFAFEPSRWNEFDTWIVPRPVGYLTRGTSENIYTTVAHELGFDNAPIPSCPYLYYTANEKREIHSLMETILGESWRVLQRDMLYVQMATTEQQRTPHQWAERLALLRTTFPQSLIVAVGTADHYDGPLLPGVVFAMQDRGILYLPPREAIVPKQSPQHMVQLPTMFSPKSAAYLMSLARGVMTPDSFALHAAAAFDTPTLALWASGREMTDAATADGLAADPITGILSRPIPPPVARMGTYRRCVVTESHRPLQEQINIFRGIIAT